MDHYAVLKLALLVRSRHPTTLARLAARRLPATVTSPRRATDVTLPEFLPQEARYGGRTCIKLGERGLVAAVASMRPQRWLQEYRAAIIAFNVEMRGVTRMH